ncbi:MAG TPA: hypothetical protein VGG82_10205 [Casimicrobiaceae bacterium]
MNVDPIEGEFFSTEALGSLADAVVREAIQNSLDARRPGTPARVRIAFSGSAAALTGERRERYLDALMRHVAASRNGGDRAFGSDAPLDFVVIEDFGTRGLQGDPRQSEDEEIGAAPSRNDFYYFWRNVGRSRKGSSELGRWGLGKTVFAAASRASAFFALTIRADDLRPLLMGQAVLRIHKLDGARYYPYGYFGCFDGDFALPIEDAALIEAFRRDFDLARVSEPGLSVVIPFPDRDLTPQALLPSLAHHYFIPILAGDLAIDVDHDGKRETLNAESFERVVERVGRSEASSLPQLVDLARWGLALASGAPALLPEPAQSVAPRWSNDVATERALAPLREPFNRADRIAVRVPVWVKPAAGDAAHSTFDVWLERDDTISAADEQFVRDGITIAGVRGGVQAGVRAIVRVRDRALSALLGDSENPAHTEWQERSPRFKDRYRHGPSTLRYVKGAPREIVRLLTRPAEGRDFALLRHVFSLDVPTEESVRKREPNPSRAGLDGSGEARGISTVRGAHAFELQRLQGGFCVAGVANGEAPPRYLAVRAAYEVRRGNPFTLYQPFDFELDRAPIALALEGATFVRQRENELVVRIDDASFRVTVQGFDSRRDVRVKAVPLDEEPAA